MFSCRCCFCSHFHPPSSSSSRYVSNIFPSLRQKFNSQFSNAMHIPHEKRIWIVEYLLDTFVAPLMFYAISQQCIECIGIQIIIDPVLSAWEKNITFTRALRTLISFRLIRLHIQTKQKHTRTHTHTLHYEHYECVREYACVNWFGCALAHTHMSARLSISICSSCVFLCSSISVSLFCSLFHSMRVLLFFCCFTSKCCCCCCRSRRRPLSLSAVRSFVRLFLFCF